MTEVRYLSYILEDNIPVYRNKGVSLLIKSEKSMVKGDSCNTYRFSMENHWGTHVDAPAHFFKAAKKVTDYSAESWIFKNPCVIRLDLKRNEVLALDKIKGKVNKVCDILLLNTGFGRFRGSDLYSFDNPSVGPEVGRWLRKERPDIHAMGFDFISLGSPKDRSLARKSHRAFLSPRSGGRPIIVIEDMDLSSDLTGLKSVIVAPFLIRALDSAPCTVLGIFAKKTKRRRR